MKFMPILILLFCFVFSSCSTSLVRMPAQEDQSLLNEALSINFSKNRENGEDLTVFAHEKMSLLKKVVVNFVPVDNMPEDKAFILDLDVEDKSGKYIQTIYHSRDAFKDKGAVYTLINFSQNMTFTEGLQSQTAIYEMYYNARKGHAISIKNIAELRFIPNIYLFAQEESAFFKSDIFQERSIEANSLRAKLDADIKKFRAKQKELSKIRKDAIAPLDKLPQDQQLKALIAKNDRQGVADLIKKYLPYELMAPFEKKYWDTYLDIMVNPAPLEERVLVYRGVDGDFVHTPNMGGRKYNTEEAIKEAKAFFMSTIMVKNQGSWNRRLRSLETMYDKEIGILPKHKDLAESMRIGVLLNNHANNPLGSPFLSFTPNLNIARSFGAERITSYLIDPRLLTYNVQGMPGEAEFLMALTTFPDEMVGFYDKAIYGDLDQDGTKTSKLILEKQFNNFIENEFGPVETKEVANKIKKNSYNFFLRHYRGTISPELENIQPGPSNLKFYNKLKKDALKPLLGPTGNLNCADIISLFWKSLN